MGKPNKGGKSKRVKIGRIVRTRKDGEEIRFKSYDGEKKSGRYAPLFSLWSAPSTDDRQPLISVSLEPNVDLSKIDTDEEFLNLYFEDGVSVEFDMDEIGKKRGKKGGKKSRKEEPDEEES